MSEIAVQFASRYIKRKQSDAVGKNLLKTLTEPVTNSDDSYGEIVKSETGAEKAIFPITIFVDKQQRLIRVIDSAQGMTTNELQSKFKEYGAAKSAAYKGGNSRGIFGQGISDVLFYHRDGKIKSIKGGEASVCSFYWKKDKQYINVESFKGSATKASKEWGINGDRGTVIEFVLDNTTLHDYENLVKKLSIFYMLRLINNNDRREVKLVYTDKGETKESLIKYEFPKGDLIESKKFTLKFENYEPVTVDVQLYKSASPLPTVGDERENGLLVYDDKEAVYDQTFFGLDDLPGADKFFGSMKLSGAREIILKKINDSKHPEAILSDSRDGFNKQHDFYKQLAQLVKDWLFPILNEERRKRTNDGISESTIEKHRKAFEELNKLYKELTGDDVSGTIRTKKKTRPVGGIQFARNNIAVTFGKRYGLQLVIDTRVIKPGATVTLKSSKNLIGFSPATLVVEEAPEGEEDLLVKTIIVTGSKARAADTLTATAGKRTASVVVSIVSEEVVYPDKGIVFSPEYVKTTAKKDSVLSLYVDLSLVKKGSKVTFSSTNDSIVLKKTKISVPGRMRSTPKVAKIEVVFHGLKDDEAGIIEARTGEYLAQCRVDIKEKKDTPPSGVTGLFKDWDFDDSLSQDQQSALDTIDGSPTQGFILVNSSHPINKRYFGENPQKKETLESHKAQLYVAELILNTALGRMINDAYQKGVIPTNYGPATDIPVYIAHRKFEFGELIYGCFVEEQPTGLEARRVSRLEEAKQKSETDEAGLLDKMGERARTMVEMYFGLGEQRQQTLEEIATRFDITRERVRQIINKALAPARTEEEEAEEMSGEVDARDYILEEEMKMKSKVEQIISRTAHMYRLKPEDLQERTRRESVVMPRMVVMYLLRSELGLSFPAIGKMFEKDHTTVLHACGRIRNLIGTDKRMWRKVSKIQHDMKDVEVLVSIPETVVE